MSTMMIDEGLPATGQKVMLATTAYADCDASYTFSIQQSREALTEAGVQSAYILLTGNCHVDAARDSVVHTFMQTDCTELVFLDADVSWRKQDLVKLCQFDLDLVGGVYKYKDESVDSMPFTPLDGASLDGDLIEVEGLPTGFMRIRRNVFETLIPKARMYDTMQKDLSGVALLFNREIDGQTRIGGDIQFCRNWREAGGKIYAFTEAYLGHSVKTVISGSLGAYIRRVNNQTLPYVVQQIRDNIETEADYKEARDYVNNNWGINAGSMLILVSAARKADGPIIETGSGISTILMAAANPDQNVWCIEHNPHFAQLTRNMARACGLSNIIMVHCDIADNWYAVQPADKLQMPIHFALGFNDGPPRDLGDRVRFLEEYGHRCNMIISDDADDDSFADALTVWAKDSGRCIAFPAPRTAIIMEAA